jgi:molybdopterin-binding protein
VTDQGLYYEVSIAVEGVTFKSLITKSALFDLDMVEGSKTFLSFKATAIHTF